MNVDSILAISGSNFDNNSGIHGGTAANLMTIRTLSTAFRGSSPSASESLETARKSGPLGRGHAVSNVPGIASGTSSSAYANAQTGPVGSAAAMSLPPTTTTTGKCESRLKRESTRDECFCSPTAPLGRRHFPSWETLCN